MHGRDERRQPDALHRLRRNVDVFIVRARDAAVSLYTISHFHDYDVSARASQCDIASRLFAVVGAVSSLSTHLSAPQHPLLDAQNVEILSNCIVACTFVLECIDIALKSADEIFKPGSTLRRSAAGRRILAFTPDAAIDAQDALQSCFHIVTKMTIAARKQDLDRRGYLTDQETIEGLRLTEAFRHPDFHALLGSMDSPARSGQAAPQATNIPSILKGSFPLHARALASLPQPYDRAQLQAKNDGPIWALNQCPPDSSAFFNNKNEQCQIQSVMASERGKTEELPPPTEATENTPASWRENTPAFELDKGAGASKTDVDGLTASMLDIGVTQSKEASEASKGPASSNQAQEKDQLPASTQSTTSKPEVGKTSSTSVFGPLHHLEAYILRPHMQTFNDYITWSPTIERLHLDESAIQAHVNKLGPDYSLIDAVGELLPEQVRLVQARTKSRHGRLVSLQQGTPADMVTQMGTFQIKPVIFIITTAALPEKEGNAITPASLPEVTKPMFSGNTWPWLSFAAPAPVPAAPVTTNLFQANKVSPMYGMSFDSANAHYAYLQERGEDCFLVEKDGINPHNIQRYMTITTGDRYSRPRYDRSLEELRVEDYKAGRTGPMKTNGLHPWENRITREVGGNPFGDQYSHFRSGVASGVPAAPHVPPPANHGLFGGIPPGESLFGGMPASTGGLFGNRVPSSEPLSCNGHVPNASIRPPNEGPPQATGSVFGRPSLFAGLDTQNNTGGGLFAGLGTQNNARGSLFGQRATSNQGVFGTAAPAPTSNGLFGQCANTTSTSLFGAPLAPTSASSLFKTTPTPAPPSISLFGAAPTVSSCSPPRPSTGLFGPASAFSTGPGLFGNTTNAPTIGVPGKSQTTPSSFSAVPRSSSPYSWATSPSNGVNAPPIVATPSNTTTLSTSNPFTQKAPTTTANSVANNPFASASPVPRSGTSRALSFCKTCNTSLAFHPAAEKSAGQCDACSGSRDANCWLCELKVRTNDSGAQSQPKDEASVPKAEEAPLPVPGNAPVYSHFRSTLESENLSGQRLAGSAQVAARRAASSTANEHGSVLTRPRVMTVVSPGDDNDGNVFTGFGVPSLPLLQSGHESPGSEVVDRVDDEGNGKAKAEREKDGE
ncbi:uncharacterized protein K460DRAFT_392305 [Cucurbitaria berberidis CBS 394.84]|uniref:Uncharacterized protein n=1 Tax=Cucurbitaria berberidis CBS 394.84 TaxID=1168544 RepID=A0A9P4LEQ7_9PLEO|nr:uncharacterized protein K460DRAFT_392305 [Cucurbitaria berberidis CBS 394.84]KAF1852188.1 hypothetical protein K460DRAFT_392305 [Cucurbitaria berberidis CBS 394.84]